MRQAPMFRGYSIDSYRLLAETSVRSLLRIGSAEARASASRWIADLRAIRAIDN